MNMRIFFLLLLVVVMVGCSTVRYISPATTDASASFRVENKQGGNEIKMGRLEPGAQHRTNKVMALTNQAVEEGLLHEKATEAIRQDTVLAPAPARADGAYPVVFINRNRSQERTIQYWYYGPSMPQREVTLPAKSHAVVYLRSGSYYFKVLDRNGKLLKVQQQMKVDRLTGEVYRYAPSEVNQIDVPEEYTYGDVTYQGHLSID